MFIATTAIEKYWDKDQKILFLGEWCKKYHNNKKLERLNTTTLPYHWNGSSDMDLALKEIDITYSKTLTYLTRFLNNYLNCNHEEKYYSILLGSWLLRFLHTNYDKFIQLNNVLGIYKGELNTRTIPVIEYIIPATYSNYSKLVNKDKYNLQEYSSLVKFLGIEFKDIQQASKNNSKFTYIHKITKKSAIKELILNLLNIFNSNKICITEPYFSNFSSYLKVWLKSNNIVFNNFSFNYQFDCKIDSNTRCKDLKMDIDNNFEKYISENLLNFIPVVFLEGYGKVQDILTKRKYKLSSVYYNANAIQGNTLYKFHIAKVYQNSKLITHQHGSGYGVEHELCDEKYERCVSDKFYTFGWTDGNDTEYAPFEKLNKKYSTNGKNVLLVLTDGNRYPPRLFYMPMATELIKNTAHAAVKFLNLVEDFSIRVRFSPNEGGWNIRERVKKRTKFFTESTNSFSSEFDSSKLIIMEHLGTPFYESMSMNKPIIIFINKDIYKFKNSVHQYFKALEDVGILHYSTESAAEHYKSIKDNVNKWWENDSLQYARKNFSYNFSRASRDWSAEFVKKISSEL